MGVFGRELRGLCRSPFLLVAPAVAVLAALLMQLNADYAEAWVNGDPQGDDQALEMYYTGVVFTRTSGHTAGQILALVLGAMLTLTASRPSGASRPVPPARVVAALLGGAVLALVNAAVALPLAAAVHPATHPAIADRHSYGMTFDAVPLHDPGVLRVLVTGLMAFPLYAVAGVVWGTMIRQWQWWVLIGMVWLPGVVCGVFAMLVADRVGPVWSFLLCTLVPPVATVVSTQSTAAEQYVSLAIGSLNEQYPPPLAAAAVLAGPMFYTAAGYLLARLRGTDTPRTGATETATTR
jgi:hypothetical protein